MPDFTHLHTGARIVVADEEPELLEMMVKTLRQANHRVFQAYDGMAALELCLGLKKVDLLVTNTRMPGLEGPRLIKEVRDRLPDLPILYIKNHHPGDSGLPTGLPEDVPTLQEPFTTEQLMAAVTPLLERRKADRGVDYWME